MVESMARRKFRGSIPPVPSKVKQVTIEVGTQFELSEITGNMYKDVNKVWGDFIRGMAEKIYHCVETQVCTPRGIAGEACKALAKTQWNALWAIATRLLDLATSDVYTVGTLEAIGRELATAWGVPPGVAVCLAHELKSYVESKKRELLGKRP